MFRNGRRGWDFGVKTTRRFEFIVYFSTTTYGIYLQVAETYTRALSTIAPRRATPNLHRLYIDFAKFYEEGGTIGEAEADLASARKVLEKATKVNFKNVEDLAEIWCEWAEMELRHE